MLAIQRKWYQVYTKSNCEKKLYEKISQLGLEAYLPTRKIKKQWSDRVKVVEEPAFKSYMFVKIYSDEMRLVERFSEFCFFIAYGNNRQKNQGQSTQFFPQITDQTISTITEVLESFPEAELQQKNFQKGERVIISAGSLSGYQGILVESPAGKKVVLEIAGLEQSLLIKVPLSLLQQVA